MLCCLVHTIAIKVISAVTTSRSEFTLIIIVPVILEVGILVLLAEGSEGVS